MARASQDNGKCADLRGAAGVIFLRARLAPARAYCQNAGGRKGLISLGFSGEKQEWRGA